MDHSAVATSCAALRGGLVVAKEMKLGAFAKPIRAAPLG